MVDVCPLQNLYMDRDCHASLSFIFPSVALLLTRLCLYLYYLTQDPGCLWSNFKSALQLDFRSHHLPYRLLIEVETLASFVFLVLQLEKLFFLPSTGVFSALEHLMHKTRSLYTNDNQAMLIPILQPIPPMIARGRIDLSLCRFRRHCRKQMRRLQEILLPTKSRMKSVLLLNISLLSHRQRGTI